MRRRFVILGHRAVSGPDFNLKDIPGTGGRLDVLVRCIPAALLTSHGVREDTDIYLVHLGPPEAPKVVHVRGAEVQHLNPDERTTAMLLQKALGAFTTGPVWQTSTPGVRVAAIGLEDLEAELEGTRFFRLDEGGRDIADVELAEDCVFMLGDDQGFTPEEVELLERWGAEPVSLGPVSLQADQCVVVTHNHLDRRAPP